MICAECAWEADLRTKMRGKVDADAYLNRPSMKDRGHAACKKRGSRCDCQHTEPGSYTASLHKG